MSRPHSSRIARSSSLQHKLRIRFGVALVRLSTTKEPEPECCSAIFTPFFQTPNRLLQIGRDVLLPLMSRPPDVERQMVLTMAGLKTGWLSNAAVNSQ